MTSIDFWSYSKIVCEDFQIKFKLLQNTFFLAPLKYGVHPRVAFYSPEWSEFSWYRGIQIFAVPKMTDSVCLCLSGNIECKWGSNAN